MDAAQALQSLDLTLPGPGYIAGAIGFGLIGFWAWRRGRKAGRPVTKWLGVTLMFYPCAVTPTWLLYAVGVALCAGLVLDRP